MFFLPTLNLWLSIGGLVLGAITVVLYVDHFLLKDRYLKDEVRPYIWPLILLTTAGSVILSLVYSEYFGFIPCSLCWLQRIAIYPQALLALMAYIKKDTTHFPQYGIGLSLFGLSVAVYQYIYQMMPKTSEGNNLLPCLADGSNADCAEKVINEFGFMTFPLLSAITFAFLIILYRHLSRQRTWLDRLSGDIPSRPTQL